MLGKSSKFKVNLRSPLKCVDDQEFTPLTLAALLPTPQCLKLLLGQNIPVNDADKTGNYVNYIKEKNLK